MLKRSVRRHWRCHGCNARMHPSLAEGAKQLTGVTDQEIVHVCGTCKSIHMVTRTGSLRPATSAEIAMLHRRYPGEMALIEATTFEPTNQPHGSLFIPTIR